MVNPQEPFFPCRGRTFQNRRGRGLPAWRQQLIEAAEAQQVSMVDG
jgi:hypothetical protein